MNPRSTELVVITPNHYTIDEPTIYRTRGEHANHYTIDEPTIYRTRGEHANHYTIDAVLYFLLILWRQYKYLMNMLIS
jgi:hypothetical protein